MRGLKRQHGGVYGTLMILVAVGAVALVSLALIPIYLNQMKVETAVTQVAGDRTMAQASPYEIRKSLQKRWDIEDIKNLATKDIKVVRRKNDRLLEYKYEVRTHLVSNVSLVVEFEDSVAFVSGGG